MLTLYMDLVQLLLNAFESFKDFYLFFCVPKKQMLIKKMNILKHQKQQACHCSNFCSWL